MRMKKLKLSFSSWETYNYCGYKYYLKFIKWVTPRVPIRYPLVTGSAFHDLVDSMYKECSFTNLNHVLKYLRGNWKQYFNFHLQREGSRFVSTEGSDKQLSYGFGLINKFFNFARDNGYLVKPIKSEWQFRLPYKNFLIPGKVDAIFDRPNSWEIIDFKTSWKIPEQEVVDKNNQLTLYDWAVKKLLKPDKPTQVGLLLPRKDTVIHSTRTEENHNIFLNELDKLHDLVSRSIYIPDTKHCSWCEFKKDCKHYKSN